MPAFVQSRSTGNVAFTTSFNLAYNSNVVTSNLLVLLMWEQANGNGNVVSVADSLGQTWSEAGTSSGATFNADFLHFRIWYFPNTVAGANTVTVTSVSGFQMAPTYALYEFSGVATISPLVGTGNGVGSVATTNLVVGSSTVSAPSTLVVGGAGYYEAATGPNTVAAPFNMGENVPFAGGVRYGISTCYDLTASSSEGPTFTTNAATRWLGMSASFTAGSAGPGNSPPVYFLMGPAKGTPYFRHMPRDILPNIRPPTAAVPTANSYYPPGFLQGPPVLKAPWIIGRGTFPTAPRQPQLPIPPAAPTVSAIAAPFTVAPFRGPWRHTPTSPIVISRQVTPPAPPQRPNINKPFIERVPQKDDANRLRRFTEKVSVLVNSLVGQGYIVQTGQSTYKIFAGATTLARDPGANDDASGGYAPGSLWINSITGAVWMNLTNTISGATWFQFGVGGSGSGLTGTFS